MRPTVLLRDGVVAFSTSNVLNIFLRVSHRQKLKGVVHQETADVHEDI